MENLKKKAAKLIVDFALTAKMAEHRKTLNTMFECFIDSDMSEDLRTRQEGLAFKNNLLSLFDGVEDIKQDRTALSELLTEVG